MKINATLTHHLLTTNLAILSICVDKINLIYIYIYIKNKFELSSIFIFSKFKCTNFLINKYNLPKIRL